MSNSVLLKCVTIIIPLILAGCGKAADKSDDQFIRKEALITNGIAIPAQISSASLPNNCLKAFLAVDGGEPTAFPIVQVPPNPEKLVRIAENYTVGEHTLALEFTCESERFKSLNHSNSVVLANVTAQVELVKGDNNIVIGNELYDIPDDDSDNIHNISEISNNTDPLIHNQKPVANSGRDQSVRTGVIVTLDGLASDDPNGDDIHLVGRCLNIQPKVFSLITLFLTPIRLLHPSRQMLVGYM